MKPLATNTLPSAENFQTPPTDGALSIPALSANFPISSFSSMLEVNYTKNPRLNGRDFRRARCRVKCRGWCRGVARDTYPRTTTSIDSRTYIEGSCPPLVAAGGILKHGSLHDVIVQIFLARSGADLAWRAHRPRSAFPAASRASRGRSASSRHIRGRTWRSIRPDHARRRMP